MPILKLKHGEWKEIPVTSFYTQNQSSVMARIKRSDTIPTTNIDGLRVEELEVIDTVSAPFMEGKCYATVEHGEDHDLYYEEII